MTTYCHQLKLLLWKNYILRKRHKMRLIMEILWPLFLFLLLMWVRTRGLRIPQPACHLVEKTLPSVGGFRFLQNYVCGLNNTCYENTLNDQEGNRKYIENEGAQIWEDATLLVLARDVSPLIRSILIRPAGVKTLRRLWFDAKNYLTILRGQAIRKEAIKIGSIKLDSLFTPEGKQGFLATAPTYLSSLSQSDLENLLDSEVNLNNLTKAGFDKMSQDFESGTCGAKEKYEIIAELDTELFNKLCNLGRKDAFILVFLFNNFIDKNPESLAGKIQKAFAADMTSSIMSPTGMPDLSNYDIKTLKTLLSLAKTVLRLLDDFSFLVPETDDENDKENENGVQGLPNGTRILYKVLCGLDIKGNGSAGSNLGLDNDATNQFDSIRDRLRDWRKKRPYKTDPELGPLCNTIFQNLEARPFTSLLWRLLKPIIRGRILYYPSTPFTDELMDRVDDKFSQLHELESTFNGAVTILHRLRAWIKGHRVELENLQDFLKEPGTSSTMTAFINSYAALPPSDRNDLYKVIETLKTFNLNKTEDFLERLDFTSELDSEILSCIRYRKSTPYLPKPEEVNIYGENPDAVPFDSEDDAIAAGMQLLPDNGLWAVVIFEELPPYTPDLNNTKTKSSSKKRKRQTMFKPPDDHDDLEDSVFAANLFKNTPKHLHYKIRMDSDKVDGTRFIRDRLTRKTPRRRPTIDLKYITSGFIYLQEMIEHSFIEISTGHNDLGEFFLQQFPFPCHIFDQFIRAISSTFPLFMVLSWVYAAAMIVKSVVLEKETRLKEVMRVMGCGNGVIWTSWFIDSFLVMSISSVILSIILKYGNIIQHSDITVILVLMILYSIATISFSFLISTLFTRANSAAAAGGILFFVSYLPYNFMLIWEDRLTWYHLLASSVISNVAFGFGCTYISRLEEDGLGAQWDRITIQTLPDDDFNLSYCMLMLLFDSILYFGLTLYIEAVFPGSSGVPKKWYFLIQKSFWCPNPKKGPILDGAPSEYEDMEFLPPPSDAVIENYENVPGESKVGVYVRNLSKVYSNGRVALSNLTLSFPEGQITSFLGHNGAGKTTTISILTGLFPPTHGTAKIYGKDIRTEIDSIRRDLGICPQFNVLFDRLTVEEHLLFYAGLKGKAEIMKEEMDSMLFDLGIPHKKSEFPSNLSGGMKRKLSVAIAFAGGSKTVFLDEPTSGVDPYSRRAIWELLIKYKEGRTIILTTHFMDEADILGDRIAIISQGKLKAYGSSLFLKSQFGLGYYLRLVREEPAPSEDFTNDSDRTTNSQNRSISYYSSSTAARANSADLFTNFIRLRIPTASLVDDVGTDVIFLLPYNSIQNFTSLFADLDNLGPGSGAENGTLKISSYGISDTTLEDVFLAITIEDLQVVGPDAETRCCCSCWNRMREKYWKNRSRPNLDNLPPPIVQLIPPSEDTGDEPRLSRRHSSLIASNTRSEYSQSFGHLGSGSGAGSGTNGSDNTQDTNLSVAGDSLLVGPNGNIPEEQETLFGLQTEQPDPKWKLQIWVILLKRFRNSNRNKKAIFFEIILPALFIALTLAFTLILPPPANEAPREITHTAYRDNNIFYSLPITKKKDEEIQPPDPMSKFKKTVDELLGPITLGTSCIVPDPDGEVLDQRPESSVSSPHHPHTPHSPCIARWSKAKLDKFLEEAESLPLKSSLGKCTCVSGSQICEPNVENPIPPKFKNPNGTLILDVSKYNLPDWISKTYFKYEAKRYGGYEMAVRPPEEVTLTEFIRLVDAFSQAQGVQPPRPKLPKPSYKVWFENRGWISSVAYLNALNNMILRQNLPDSKHQDHQEEHYGITLVNHPLNLTLEQQKKESIKTAALGVIHAICIIFALSFVPASFTVYLIEERKSGGKHLHLVSGVSPLTYWISNFSFDLLKYLFSALLCVTLFVIFDAKAYIGPASAGGFILLLILYGWASIPLMYPASHIFSIPSTAFVVLACTNLFIGVVTTVSTFVLDQLGDEELKEISHILQEVFLIFPHYCLGRGLIQLVKLHVEATAFGKLSLNDFEANRFEWNILGKVLACLGIHGVIFFILNISLEYRHLCYLVCCKQKLNKKLKQVELARDEVEEDDEDVKKEQQRVLIAPPYNPTLLAQNLFKIYSGKKYPAVNGLSFAVEPGECFGLLGVNGAGKSSTFRMLTGDVRITSGKAQIMGFDIETSLDSARKHYGYCPQEDGIDPLLNSYEQLELYGRLRGLSRADVLITSTHLINALGLSRYASKRCGTYSGGNKRKLSTAISLIGNPNVIFLDEPTSGMDPGARRQLWKLILNVTHLGKSVVLTSHSMEECEALCTRLAIMVNGRFTCIGSLQHLKNRFGSGYMITVRCEPSKQEEFLAMITEALPSAQLDDSHCSQLKLHVGQEDLSLGQMFEALCSAKNDQLIHDFSLSQTTLDDIFVRFASKQRDDLEVTQKVKPGPLLEEEA